MSLIRLMTKAIRPRALVLALAGLLAFATHAQEAPNLFNSLGKLLKPKAEAAEEAKPATRGTAVATADNRNLAVTQSGEKRVALVIGNADYKNGPLTNPVNDARAMAAKLQSLGFTVVKKENLTTREIGSVYREFRNLITPGGIALVFYAGHGLQFKGQNYFPAIDADISSEDDVPLQSVNLGQLLDNMEESKAGVSLVLLDACRDNPFARRFRSASRGLAKVEAASGTLIHYATKPGSVASDGEGSNGTYTEALLKVMDAPGVPVELVFKRVTSLVKGMTAGKQEPWVEGSLSGEFYFKPGEGTQVAQLGPGISIASRSPEQIEDELWDAIKGSNKASVFEEYMKQYPQGRYLAQARVKLAGLRSEATKPTTPVAVKPALPPPAASDDPDTALWKAVEQGNSVDDYDVYLKQYPKGKYVALAKQRLQKLKDEAKQKAEAEEQSAWQSAESTQTAEGYAAYLASYPRGKFATLAQARTDKLKREATDRERLEAARAQREQADAALREEADLWRKAESAEDSATVQSYLDRYPAGRYVAAARLKLAAVKKKEAEGPRIGAVFKDCTDCPEMVVISAGSFEMGGTNDGEKPVHTVRIGKPFAIGKTEVTQGQWRAVMGNNPSHFSNCGDTCPVEKVNWDDAQEFVRKLSQKTGKTYRLPSEAEWEYACRAGGRHEYCGSDSLDSVGWYGFYANPKGNSAETTNPVARKQANAWGLYDMSGNVWEWTQDCWNANYNGAPPDGSAWTSGDCGQRVLRGGSWDVIPQGTRSAFRSRYTASSRSSGNGFRLARMLP